MERPRGEAVRGLGHLSYRLVGQLDQSLVEEDRLDRPDPLPGDVDSLLLGELVGELLGPGKHRREVPRDEVTLVEKLLGRLDD